MAFDRRQRLDEELHVSQARHSGEHSSGSSRTVRDVVFVDGIRTPLAARVKRESMQEPVPMT